MPLISNITTVLLLASIGGAILGFVVVWAVLAGAALAWEGAVTLGANEAAGGQG